MFVFIISAIAAGVVYFIVLELFDDLSVDTDDLWKSLLAIAGVASGVTAFFYGNHGLGVLFVASSIGFAVYFHRKRGRGGLSDWAIRQIKKDGFIVSTPKIPRSHDLCTACRNFKKFERDSYTAGQTIDFSKVNLYEPSGVEHFFLLEAMAYDLEEKGLGQNCGCAAMMRQAKENYLSWLEQQ